MLIGDCFLVLIIGIKVLERETSNEIPKTMKTCLNSGMIKNRDNFADVVIAWFKQNPPAKRTTKAKANHIIAIIKVSNKKIKNTSLFKAPSARRMPISCLLSIIDDDK